MDFGKLLMVAQQNSVQKEAPKACYQTKFTPLKKEVKQSKELSDNIKKFLAKKELEEKKKALEEQKKKENLLALRDHKAQSRISKHLKICKAANKSVIADAIDNDNTAITITGPAQCDEDDYGYVSQEASALYAKLMNKYSSLPPEKPLFSEDGKRSIKDIASTKDRVKQALKQQEIEESQPHRRKRKRKDSESDEKIKKENEQNDRENEKDRDRNRDKEKNREKEQELEKEEKLRPKKRPIPPPVDFTQLLKIAEKVKDDPIKILPKPKPNPDAERLMTKKQIQEYAKEKEWREMKEKRKLNPDGQASAQTSSDSKSNNLKSSAKSSNSKTQSEAYPEKTGIKSLPPIAKKSNGRPIDRGSSINKPTEKSNGMQRSSEKNSKPVEKNSSSYKTIDKTNSSYKPMEKTNGSHKSTERTSSSYKTSKETAEKNKILEKSNNNSRPTEKSNGISKSAPKVSEKDAIAEERRKLEEEKRQLQEMRRSIEEEKRKFLMSKTKKVDNTRPSSSGLHKSISNSNNSKLKESVKSSSSLSKNSSSTSTCKARPFPPADIKPRQFPPADVKPRQFPPPDVRSLKPKPSKLKVNKRRILDDDEEYDSELDDFIDDGPLDEQEDYSKYISEIFGYDKSKYRDHDDDDDAAMESNFAQQLKEEFVSTKIGIMEDLEDMRNEAMEKKRKKQLFEQLKKKRKT